MISGNLSRAILEDVLTAIDAFVSGRDEIVDIQARLCADASALGRSHLELINELRSLDADLEEI